MILEKKRHIVIVTNLFPNKHENERGLFIFQLVEKLKNYLNITVISPVPFFPSMSILSKFKKYHNFSQLEDIEHRNGYDVYFCRHLVIPKMGFFRSYTLYKPLLRIMKEIENNCKIDLINAHWVFPDGVAAQWVGKKLEKPVVISARGCDINFYPQLSGRRQQIVKSLCNCEGITAVSRDLKRNIMLLGIDEEKITMIENGIDFEKFHSLDRLTCRKKLRLNCDDKIILFAGSLCEVKGTKLLLEAYAKVIKDFNFNNLKLMIVGDGYLRSELESLSKSLGVNNNISFLGNQPHDVMPILFNAANVFCLPSIREGRPNVILEAMACGIPVVASDVGGIPELIVPGVNGLMFDSGNVNMLSERLITALSVKWSSVNIRNTVLHLDWNVCSNHYLKKFTDVLKNRYIDVNWFDNNVSKH